MMEITAKEYLKEHQCFGDGRIPHFRVSELMEEYHQAKLKNLGVIGSVIKGNWFERLPLHWKLTVHLIGGIILGLLLPYV